MDFGMLSRPRHFRIDSRCLDTVVFVKENRAPVGTYNKDEVQKIMLRITILDKGGGESELTDDTVTTSTALPPL